MAQTHVLTVVTAGGGGGEGSSGVGDGVAHPGTYLSNRHSSF